MDQGGHHQNLKGRVQESVWAQMAGKSITTTVLPLILHAIWDVWVSANSSTFIRWTQSGTGWDGRRSIRGGSWSLCQKEMCGKQGKNLDVRDQRNACRLQSGRGTTSCLEAVHF